MDRTMECSECGLHLENMQQYAGCPAGHGKLHPWITNEDMEEYAEESVSLAEVVSEKPKRYKIGDVPDKRYRCITTMTGAFAYKQIVAEMDGSLISTDKLVVGPWKRGFARLREVDDES